MTQCINDFTIFFSPVKIQFTSWVHELTNGTHLFLFFSRNFVVESWILCFYRFVFDSWTYAHHILFAKLLNWNRLNTLKIERKGKLWNGMTQCINDFMIFFFSQVKVRWDHECMSWQITIPFSSFFLWKKLWFNHDCAASMGLWLVLIYTRPALRSLVRYFKI